MPVKVASLNPARRSLRAANRPECAPAVGGGPWAVVHLVNIRPWRHQELISGPVRVVLVLRDVSEVAATRADDSQNHGVLLLSVLCAADAGRVRHYFPVAISDKDRKVLWARSGNRCALCRRSLVADRTEMDREAVVGDEAHIAARSPGGPRYGECPAGLVDSYDNLILLCKVDHKRVDDQPGHFTSETLRKAKTDHETWVDDSLRQREGVQISFPDHAGMFPLTVLRTGTDVWNVVDSVHRYYLEDLDDAASDEDLDCSASFLQNAKDWGEISADVTAAGMRAVRDAKRSLSADVDALQARGLVALGGARHGLIRGGALPPGRWSEAFLIVMPGDDERVDTLRWAVPPTGV